MRPVAKQFDDSRIHRDVARLPILGISDRYPTCVEIQISPLQIPNLASAHPGVKGDRYNCAYVWCDASLNQTFALLEREVAEPRIVLMQESEPLHRTLIEALPVDCAVE